MPPLPTQPVSTTSLSFLSSLHIHSTYYCLKRLICSCKYLPILCLSHRTVSATGAGTRPSSPPQWPPGQDAAWICDSCRTCECFICFIPGTDHLPEVVLKQKLRIKRNLELLQKLPGQPRKGVSKTESSRERAVWGTTSHISRTREAAGRKFPYIPRENCPNNGSYCSHLY